MSALKVCNILCYKKEDFEMLKLFLKDYPVYLSQDPEILEEAEPTLIIGWENIKKLYPTQNIFDKEIYETIFSWSFSHEEEKSTFFENVKEFVNKEIEKWLPKKFKIYDPFFDGGLDSFIDINLNFDTEVYVYHHNGALYASNDGNNYVFNIKSLLFEDELCVVGITKFLNRKNVICFSYSNIDEIVELDKLVNPSFESIYWVKYGFEVDENKQFNIIPNFPYHKYVPFFMGFMGVPEMDEEDESFCKRMIERDKVTTFCSTRTIPLIKESKIKKGVEFGDLKLVSVKFSNKRTITNRIMCKDSWNVQGEPKDSLRRREMVSRFKGGKILVCDYTSFETRISAFLTRNIEFITKYKNKDIHYEVGKIIFEKEVLSDEERSSSKLFNHAMLYGAGYSRLLDMVSKMGVEEPRERIHFVEKMMEPIISNSKFINSETKKNGYLVTPWGSIIKPEKEFAAYNNLVQSTAAEIMVDKIIEIKECLKDKESEFMFQVHDSLIFDLSPSDKGIFKELLDLISKFKKTSFPIAYKFGDNYLDLSKEQLYSI